MGAVLRPGRLDAAGRRAGSDDPHSAAAELALEGILTGEGRLELEDSPEGCVTASRTNLWW